MKIAHMAVVTPHRAGLYETTRDLVAAERKLGVDAYIVDPLKEQEGTDRDVPLRGWTSIAACDVIVSHSGLGDRFKNTDRPIIHMLHGRPYSSFLLEQAGKIPVFTFLRQVADNQQYKAFVTFWEDYLPYWQLLLPRGKLHSITPPVDLQLWTPDGLVGYGFHGNKGTVNVICAEMWRDDIDPFHILVAYARFAETRPGARLHIYAAPQKGTAWQVFLSILKERGVIGEVLGFVQGLDNVYRAADVAITAQQIATRSVREAMACGCPVVMASGNRYSDYTANPEHIAYYAAAISDAIRTSNRRRVRETAEDYFNPEKSAREFLAIVEGVLNGSRRCGVDTDQERSLPGYLSHL